MELVHRSVDLRAAAALGQVGETVLGQVMCRELRPEVAASLLGVPHLRDQRVERFVVESGRRDDDPLVRQCARVGRHASGLDAADVCVVRARDGEAERRAGDEGHVGEVRAAGVRVVEHEHVAGRGVVAHHRGDRVRHRPQVDGDVLGLGDHPATLVEDRGRAVAPLLDVGREGGADEHRAHLLGDRAQRAAENLELDFHDLVTIQLPLFPSLTPTHPGGNQQVEPSSSSTPGPDTSRRLPG